MTRNYINGFMSKMAEYGVRRDIAEQLLIKSASKSPTEENEVGSISLDDPRGLPPQSRSPDSVSSTAGNKKTVSEEEMRANRIAQLRGNMTDEEWRDAYPKILEAEIANSQPASVPVDPAIKSRSNLPSRSPETVAAEKERPNNLGNGINTAQPAESTANERGAVRTWLYGNRGAIGAAGGALAAGGLGAYLANRLTKNKKNKRRNAIIAALAAGGLGGVGGYYGARRI